MAEASVDRVVLMAFDSPDLGILQRGVEEGWLPVTAQLLERGRFIPLWDLQTLVTPTSWPTLITGAPLADHLVLSDSQLIPGTYRIAPILPESSRRPPFWRHISDVGLRSTLVGVYGAPLLQDFAGTQLVGWGALDPFNSKVTGPRSDPPELIATLEREIGRPDIRYGFKIPRTRRQFRVFLERSFESVRKQTATLISLLERTEWEFFFGGFWEAHVAGHLIWHLQGEDNPDHVPEADPFLRDGLKTICRAVDDGIGEVLNRVPGKTAFFLVTPYVLGPHSHLDDAVETILERGGWFVRRAGDGAQVADRRLRALGLARRAVHRIVPAGLRPALGRLVPRDRLLGELALADVDWSSTTAFPLPSDGSSFVRLNLAGREPEGIVEPGASYDALCADIAAAISSCVAADTGEPIAARVERTDSIFDITDQGALPDLCVEWAPNRRIKAVRSPELGIIEVPTKDPRTAAHISPGFMLGMGPGIEPSGGRSLDGPGAALDDVGATVLSLFGIPQPDTITGRPIVSFASRGER